jgi:16S rRNA (cytosine1402-N4)-methyltransferase
MEESFDRIAIDLGVSSFQLDQAERGFSFQKKGPLDMRMNPEEGQPAWEKLLQVTEKELADIFYFFGEEPRARAFARRWMTIRKTAKIRTTEDFVQAFGHRLDSKDPKGRHPLTRIFQGIRIWVNDEFGQIDRAMELLPQRLKPGGRLGVITFHSLEDRKVKSGLRGKLIPVNKKVIVASDQERSENPRARSAKLRVYEREME